eukprot:CAMPEP_0184985730 /NCGR_PEP_ID=MMETSP1098-20130426/14265_1 /TAXON_ID=89044 /ORGANISM="Spumella elongata, Strain CCAP 955/1" /LENGTH=277 /DNA_ID=CAMNT_0027509827 /DNA_START=26 /DNA_END=859 /DNA_ORIENTATION=-
MSFEGTRFEKLENSIKNEINRKRKSSSGGKVEKANRSAKVPRTKQDEIRINENQLKAKRAEAAAQQKSQPAARNVPLPAGSEVYTNERTVYVQGLPFGATEDDVRNFFKGSGDIASIRLPKWHDSGKLKGYGHIEFKKSEGAAKALDLNGEYLQDRYLTIERPMVPRALSNSETIQPSEKPAGCRTIFIKNLPYETSEAEITETFRVYGPIKNVRLAVWNHTGKLKGIGYIEFKREDSAETAVKKSGLLELKGRKILTDYETGAPKGSYRKSDAPAK